LPLGFDPAQVAALLKLGDEMKSRGMGEDREGASRYTRIIVNVGTAEPLPDLPGESTPSLCDDTSGDGFVDGDNRKLN
jgi:hypothetical protein